MKISDIEGIGLAAKEVREARSTELDLWEMDYPLRTFTTTELCDIFPSMYGKSRQAREDLNRLAESGLREFSRAPNNALELTFEDINFLCEHYELPVYRHRDLPALVLSFINLKGGVGKSTATITAAEGLAVSLQTIKERRRVLVIDVDPQGTLTKQALGHFNMSDDFTSAITLMAMEPESISYEFIKESSIKKTKLFNVDIIPCTTDDGFKAAELQDIASSRGEALHTLMRNNLIKHVEDYYDFILIDAGPHLDSVLTATIGCLDGIFIPTPPKSYDFDSTLKFLEGLPRLFKSLIEDGYDMEKLQFIKSFLNMEGNEANYQKNLYNSNASNDLFQIFGDQVLDNGLAQSDVYQRCQDKQVTVFTMKPATYEKSLGSAEAFKKAFSSAEDWFKSFNKAVLTSHALKGRNYVG